MPVTALVVIWGFTATLTVERGAELLRIQTVYDNVLSPVGDLISELQRERFLSIHYLTSANPAYNELDAQRAHTDAAADRLKTMSDRVVDETPPAMRDRLTDLLTQIGQLNVARTKIDGRQLSRLDTIDEYSAITELGFQVYDRLTVSTDLDLIQQTQGIILISRSHEIVSQESALVTGALAIGRMTANERDAFSGLVGKRRLLYELGTDKLDPDLSRPIISLNASLVYASFISVENGVMNRLAAGRPLPPDAIAWPTSTEALVHSLTGIDAKASQTLVDRAVPIARDVLLRIGITGILGLVSVLATVLISFRFARRLTDELTELHSGARDLADRRLPSIVQRLRRGEDVDVAAETPPLVRESETVEVENLGHAIDSVEHTAVEAAVGQAKLRKGVNRAFLNLARRSQSLLQRQLSMLDGLEKEIADPDLLERLFGVDHLTTRMRRHAEGLIILSGAAPGRGWRDPVPLYDVTRAAVEEVEDYLRVNVLVPHGHALAGAAVTDIVHMLAELIENATIFSPPHTEVYVRGEAVGRGFALEIEDRGLGITPDELEHFNERLADPPEFDLTDSDRLGLFVVGLLARRHGVQVSLRSSPYGGTSAIVVLPQELVVDDRFDGFSREFSVERVTPPTAPALTLTPPPSRATSMNRSGTHSPIGANGSNGEGPGSLPRRVRQANLAPQLREEGRFRDEVRFRDEGPLPDETPLHDGRNAGEQRTPGDGRRPAEERRPDAGTRPGTEWRPGDDTQPGTEWQSEDEWRPADGRQPGGDRPDVFSSFQSGWHRAQEES